MKTLRPYLCILTLLSSVTLMAQQPLLSDATPIYTTVRQWQPTVGTDSVFTWPFTFGEDSAQAELLLRLLKNQFVTKIQLVYSRYSVNKKFDQQVLNQQRLQRLSTLHPEWFDPQSGIEWEFVEQTGCTSPKGCSGYFHGFIFYYMSRAEAIALYRHQLMAPRRTMDRIQEIEAFNYWFDQNINKDKKYTTLPKDTGQSQVDALNRPETPDQQQQRIVQIMQEVQEAKTARQDLRTDGKTEKKKDRKNETTETAKDEPSRSDKTEKNSATKDKLASGDQKQKEDNKNGQTTPAPSSAKKQGDKDEVPPVQRHKVRFSNKKASRSTVLDIYYSITYPKNKAHGPTWTQYVMDLLRKRKEYTTDGWLEWMSWTGGCDSIHCETCIPPPPDSGTCRDCFVWRVGSRRILSSDGTVTASMQRLSEQYSSMNVIGDVTLGMLGTMQDLIYWANDPRNVVQIYKAEFYNDGDHTPDIDKVIGKTGGLYPTDVCSSGRTRFLDILYGQMRLFGAICHSARAGDGGDVPENALEACRDAQGRCGNCDALVLIADNRSPVRDISLLHDITKPLHIILPFVKRERGLVNTEYLDMARQTHGVIHILERAYYDLDKMKDGDTLKIYEYKYLLLKDHFICIEVSKEPLKD